MRKVQTQLLVSPVTRDRADALALVRKEPRAEVLRVALEGGGLSALETQHAEALAELATIAADMGTTRADLVAKMTADKIGVEDVRGRKRYPRLAGAKA